MPSEFHTFQHSRPLGGTCWPRQRAQLPPITLRIELSALTRAKAPSMVHDALKSCKVPDACIQWLKEQQVPLTIMLDGLDELPERKLRVLAETDAKDFRIARSVTTC